MIEEGVYIFDNLRAAGFMAGTVLKGAWRNQAEIYDFVGTEILSGKKTIISPIQTHSSEIVFIHDPSNTDNNNADGIMSDSKEVCLTVKTADCIPILLADPSTGVFGAVHVGWRGFLAGIVEELLAEISERGLRPESIRFGLGPSIGKCCFETGEEVAVLFDESSVSVKHQAMLVDLKGAAIEKLLAAGVAAGNIEDVDDCTACSGEKYYSYRKTGDASLQMVSFIFRSE
jgi:YfiH family protein